jgi:diguanylate cyclase (GGDEF)-like protein/PAS domain S-box-containing protein
MTKKSKSSQKIFLEQIELLYGNAIVPILVSVLVGALFCWSQKNVTYYRTLLIWFALLFIVSAARISLVILFQKRKPESVNSIFWYNYFLIGTYAAGAVWGAASFMLFPEYSEQSQTVFFLILTGLAAGAIASLCPSAPAVLGYLSLVLLPLPVKMIMIGSSEAMFVGLMVMLFWAIVVVGSMKISGNIQENIELRLLTIEREKKLRANEERYRHIFSSAPLGIFQYNVQSVINDCNDAFVNIIGSSREKLVGLNMFESLKDQGMLGGIKDSLTKGEGYYEGDYLAVTSNKITPVRVFLKAIRSARETIIGGVGIVEDFTEKRWSEQQIQYYTTYDSLTGLPNRRLLLDHLSNEISRSVRHGHYGALLFIDLDNFKTINDSLGHSIGDEVLKLVSKRLTESIRREDSVARMGGDEFILILTELDDAIDRAAEKARNIAEEISHCISAPCTVEGHEMHITPSIGVSLFPKPGIDSNDILKQADTAMYKAKAAGCNEIRFFSPSMQDAADERLRLHGEIRRALDKEEFTIYYQPQVDKSGRLIGAEALLRWHHSERGMVPPDAFLPVAEETGIMTDIGKWVLRTVCGHIKKWADSGQLNKSLSISVNISGKEFYAPDFVETVVSILDETGADPNYLGIELTEGSIISPSGDIVEKIMTLRRLGITFSIDDFGTGYSSLSYLKSLPLNTLKIDRSFVNDIGDSIHGVVLVDTIIMMARNLDMEVIAEGVETEQELLYLSSKGCNIYQGYYFSRPVAIAAFNKILAQKNSNFPN